MNKKDLFKDHKKWIFSEYMARNTETGVELWTSNGSFFFTGCNGRISFGLIERHFLWRHYQKMLLRKALGYDE